MGATNALAAFDLYAGLVPPTSLLLLVRMALVSKDTDQEPWFSEGNKALARMALGRGRHAEVDETDLKAVQRALSPLHKVGAITTVRAPSIRRNGHDTAKYQLHLRGLHAGRKPSTVDAPSRRTESVPRGGVEDPPRGTFSGVHGGRKPSGTGDENRPPEETGRRQEETERTSRDPSPSTALATVVAIPTAEQSIIRAENAGTITAAWVDHCQGHALTLPRDLIGRYAKSIKQALDDGFEPNLIKRALGRMLDDGQASWPGTFAAYLVRVQETPAAQRPRNPTPGEQSAARLVTGAEQPGEVIDAVQRFFERGAS